MTELKSRIHDKSNGLDYVLVGDYYVPDLKLPEEHRPIGMWAAGGRRLVFWPIAQQEDHRRQPAAGGTCRHSQCDPADDGGQRCGRGLGSDTFGMDWRLRG